MSMNYVLKANRNQVRYTLKLTQFESIDYNNEEHIIKCIKCQSFFRGRWKYGWCVILEGFIEDEYVKQICLPQRDQNKSLLIVVCHGVMAHDVTLGAYNVDKFFNSFKARSFIIFINKGSFSWTMSHFTNFMTYNKVWKRWVTFIFICHHIVIPKCCRVVFEDIKSCVWKMISKTMEHC
jgi:hypothetical protein